MCAEAALRRRGIGRRERVNREDRARVRIRWGRLGLGPNGCGRPWAERSKWPGRWASVADLLT